MRMFSSVLVVLLSLMAVADHKGLEFWRMTQKGVRTCVALHVIDDCSLVVPDATVMVRFSRIQEIDTVQRLTDERGNCVVEVLTSGNSIEICVSKVGYYDSKICFSYIGIGDVHDIQEGKWLPYPMKKTITLRKIHEPVEMITAGGTYELPCTNRWVPFDMVAGDWVSPHGKGLSADVAMKFNWFGAEPMRWERQCFEIRFLHDSHDGARLLPARTESVFPYSFQADPIADYEHDFSDENESSKRKSGMLDGTRDMVFRIRSVTDGSGNLIACHYGRFRRLDYGVNRKGGCSLLLRYEYNPISNATNIESKIRK